MPSLLAGVDAAEAGERRRLVALAERVGLDHLGVGDHVSFVDGIGFDGLIRATSLLAMSERLATNTAVYLLPLRHPVTVARQLADIATLAPGRFIFGVGVGGEDRHEIEVCGVDPTTRGRRMDESITVVRALLDGETVDFDGEHFSLQQARILPQPPAPVPIVVGGRSQAAVRRAGRLGDGWFGVWVSPERYANAVSEMAEVAAAAGRGEVRWTNALNVWCGVGDSAEEARGYVAPAMEMMYGGLPYERFERWSPAGTTEHIAEFLVPYVAAGCSLFNLIVVGRSSEHEIEAAAEIRSLLHEAVADGT